MKIKLFEIVLNTRYEKFETNMMYGKVARYLLYIRQMFS